MGRIIGRDGVVRQSELVTGTMTESQLISDVLFTDYTIAYRADAAAALRAAGMLPPELADVAHDLLLRRHGNRV